MKCSNCGREVDNDLIFCPGCGTKVVEYVQSVADDYDDDYTVDADADDAETDYFGRVPVYKDTTRGASGGKSGTNIWLVIIAAILSAAVVLCIVVLCMGMFKGADAPTGAEKTENVCGICGDNIDAADEFCNNCTDDFTCELCGGYDHQERMEAQADLVVFFPDEGAMKRYSDMINDMPYAFGIKKREWATGKILGLDIMNAELVKDKNVLIIDDICSRGGTFLHSAKALKAAGANRIFLYVTHAEKTMVDGEMYNDLDLVERIYTTDSIFNIEWDDRNKVTIVNEF